MGLLAITDVFFYKTRNGYEIKDCGNNIQMLQCSYCFFNELFVTKKHLPISASTARYMIPFTWTSLMASCQEGK